MPPWQESLFLSGHSCLRCFPIHDHVESAYFAAMKRPLRHSLLLVLIAAAAGCGSDPAGADVTGEGDADVVASDTAVDTAEDEDTAAPDADDVASDVTPDASPDTTGPAPGLFGRADLPVVDLQLGPLAAGPLETEPYAFVPGSAVVSGTPIEALEIRHADLGDGAFRPASGKASYEIRVQSTDAGPVDGATRLVFKSMVDEASHVREQLSHLFMGLLGVVQPRATYVWLLINGEPRGLYSATEAAQSTGWRELAYGTSEGTVVAAERRVDFWPWQIDNLVVLAGDAAKRDELETFADDLYEYAEAVAEANAPTNTAGPYSYDLRDGLANWIDVDAFLRYWAASLYLSQRRSYPWGSRNYALHQSPGASAWSFVPGGLDDSFGFSTSPWTAFSRVAQMCLENLPCRSGFAAALDSVRSVAAETNFLGLAYGMREAVLGWLEDDPRRELTIDEVKEDLNAVLNELASKPGWLDANSACADPTMVDKDGDGFSGCTSDCNDDDPEIHPGHAELCNLRDDNCDFQIDNDEDEACPRCEPFVDAFGSYELCFESRTWEGAQAACVEKGGNLASIHSLQQRDSLRDGAFQIRPTGWWIGLTDAAEEGVFTWVDGTAVDFDGWADGEPNDSNGEDCVEMTFFAAGAFNDNSCDRQQYYICELSAE